MVLTISYLHSLCLVTWWEVDLGEGVAVTRVTIHNVKCCYTERLTNSVVALLNYQGTTLKSYRIESSTDIPMFDISFTSNFESGILITNAPTNAPTAIPTASPTLVPTQTPTAVPTTNNPTFDPNLVHKVRVQQDFPNGLIIAEVQVFDHNNVNVALNKPASQSSTFGYHLALSAVNGNFNDFSHTTSNDQGE